MAYPNCVLLGILTFKIKIMIIEVETKINRTIDVEVDTDDILEVLNNETIEKRFNFFGAITNALITSDVGKLRQDQKEIIKSYLERQLKEINKTLKSEL